MLAESLGDSQLIYKLRDGPQNFLTKTQYNFLTREGSNREHRICSKSCLMLNIFFTCT